MKCKGLPYDSMHDVLQRFLYRSTFCVMLLALAWQTSMHVWDYMHGVYGYNHGCINEMLVNYQGGFVRRGLFGELLFLTRGVFDFSIANAIVLMYYVSVALLTALLVWLFKKNGWSLFVAPFPICLYVYLCDPYFLIGRRVLHASASYMLTIIPQQMKHFILTGQWIIHT